MKFPREKVTIETKIKELIKSNDLNSIRSMTEDVFTNIEILDSFVVDNLFKAYFSIKDFDKVVLLYSRLEVLNKLTFGATYYMLLSLLANNDLYLALSNISKNNLLKLPKYSKYLITGGANYTNLLYASFSDDFISLALILVNFLANLKKEKENLNEFTEEEILYGLFDLINRLYERGYQDEIIEELAAALKTIFALQL